MPNGIHDVNQIEMFIAYLDSNLVNDLEGSTEQNNDSQNSDASYSLTKDLIEAGQISKQQNAVVAEEDHREAVRQILEQCGIMELRDGKWRIADGMDNKFRDAVYLARFRQREAEVSAETFQAAYSLVKRAVAVDMTSRGLTSVAWLLKDGLAKHAFSGEFVCELVAQYLRTPKTFDDLGQQGWKSVVQWANSVVGATESVAVVSEKSLNLAKNSIAAFAKTVNAIQNEAPPSTEVKSRDIIEIINHPTIAETGKNLLGFDSQEHAKLLQAFSDLYREMYPGREFPAARTVSPAIADATTKFRFGIGVSTINCLSAIYAEELFVRTKKTLYDRLKSLRGDQDAPSKTRRVNSTIKRGLEHILTATSKWIDKRYDKTQLGRDGITKMEMSVLQYNEAHMYRKDAELRGMHFASCMSELALFRSGNGSNISTWFEAVRLTHEDAAWAIAFLKAGMRPTVDGVAWDMRQTKENIAGIVEQYHMRADKTDYDKLLNDFAEEHKRMVERSNELRIEAGGQELQKQMYFDRRRDDMTIGQSLRWVNMTEREYTQTDLRDILKHHNAIIVEDKNSLYYMGKDEQRVVVGQRDSKGQMHILGLTKSLVPFANETKQETLNACHAVENERKLHLLMEEFQARKTLDASQEALLYKTIDSALQNGFSYKHDDQKSVVFTRGDLSLTISRSGDVQQAVQEFVARAKEQTWNAALQKAGIHAEMAEEALRNTKVMESFGVQVRGPYADECREFASMQGAMKLLTQDDFLDENKYNAVVSELQSNLERVAAGLTPQAEATFSDRLDYILDTKENDPELAAYLGLSENAYRCDDGMIRGEYGGVEFVVENGKALAADEQGKPDHALTVQIISGGLGDDRKEALTELWSVETAANNAIHEAIKETEFEK